jgi:hypothetical protein
MLLLAGVITAGTLILAGTPAPAAGQLTPVRAPAASPRVVELTFPTPRHLNLPTPEPLSQGEFYYSIMHTFGEVREGAGTFWGIDQGANVRFSMEYGVTDRVSVVLARSSMDRVYEMAGPGAADRSGHRRRTSRFGRGSGVGGDSDAG